LLLAVLRALEGGGLSLAQLADTVFLVPNLAFELSDALVFLRAAMALAARVEALDYTGDRIVMQRPQVLDARLVKAVVLGLLEGALLRREADGHLLLDELLEAIDHSVLLPLHFVHLLLQSLVPFGVSEFVALERVDAHLILLNVLDTLLLDILLQLFNLRIGVV